MLGTVRAIGKAIKTLVNFVNTVFDLIGSFVKQLGYMLSALTKVVGIVTQTILYLPDWLRVFGTLTVTICVVYLILGRNKGGAD